MSKERPTRDGKRGARPRSRRSGRAIAVVTILAVAGVATLIWAGNTTLSGGAPASPAPQVGRVRGIADAPVTIDEYADFQCPACGQFARTTEAQLLSTYIATGQVKLVFHHFAFLGMESSWAAEAAECAGDQGRFWDLHDKLYASQAGENKGAFSRVNLKRMGDELGLGASYAACIDSGRYAQSIRDASKAASDLGVRATPTLFVDGQKIEGAATFAQLKPIIEAALAK